MTTGENNDGPVQRGGGKVLGREALRPPLPKRFYKVADVASTSTYRHQIVLDGRAVKTPKKLPLEVPSRALAEAVAAEWGQQGDFIDPTTMPLTRLVNVAIDAVASHMDEVRADIAAFAGSDLLCYRAAGPETLVKRQHAHWDPVLAWAEHELGASFVVGEGVMPIAQGEAAIGAISRAIADLDAFRLASLHVMTTLLGSALLALSHLRGRLTAEQAWSAANVDETWQTEQWGRDAEAEARFAYRQSEFQAASRLAALID